MSLEQKINDMINNFATSLVSELVPAIRAEERQRILRALDGSLTPTPPKGKGVKGKRKKAAEASGTGRRYTRPKVCKAEGCTEQNKGPRFKFLCQDHYQEVKATEQTEETDQPIQQEPQSPPDLTMPEMPESMDDLPGDDEAVL